ncbi:MAG: PQQ-dependent sugar dehydrogenase [Acidobacteriota bacterium]
MKSLKPPIYCCILLVSLFLSLSFFALGTQGKPEAAAAEAPIALQPFLTGLAQPLLITNAGDGSRRLFIVERHGIIKVLQYGESQPTIFLDLTAKVLIDKLGGLTGLTFHPQYRNNGRFFVHYTRRDDTAVVTAEYTVKEANPDVADPASEKILIVEPKDADGHSGGGLTFAPDGFLYIGMGDGSLSQDLNNNAQNLDSLSGKILRIDVDRESDGKPYSSPSSNPFFGAKTGRDEIFAYGFRNPYRIAFDSATGELYVGDVGETMREEIDLVTPGNNYGWRVKEGTSCTNYDQALCDSLRSVAPIIEYEHGTRRCSVTGGYVYRGRRATLPQGTYVFGDLCSGEIWSYQAGRTSLLLDTGIFFLASFGEDEEGELYVVSIIDGRIYKLVNDAAIEPQVQLLAPNIPMKLKGNSITTISWRTTGTGIYRHDIQWTQDGGENWQDITSGLPAELSSYEWTVPNIATKKARVRVISYGSVTTGQDESDANFKIRPRAQ